MLSRPSTTSGTIRDYEGPRKHAGSAGVPPAFSPFPALLAQTLRAGGRVFDERQTHGPVGELPSLSTRFYVTGFGRRGLADRASVSKLCLLGLLHRRRHARTNPTRPCRTGCTNSPARRTALAADQRAPRPPRRRL